MTDLWAERLATSRLVFFTLIRLKTYNQLDQSLKVDLILEIISRQNINHRSFLSTVLRAHIRPLHEFSVKSLWTFHFFSSNYKQRKDQHTLQKKTMFDWIRDFPEEIDLVILRISALLGLLSACLLFFFFEVFVLILMLCWRAKTDDEEKRMSLVVTTVRG